MVPGICYECMYDQKPPLLLTVTFFSAQSTLHPNADGGRIASHITTCLASESPAQKLSILPGRCNTAGSYCPTSPSYPHRTGSHRTGSPFRTRHRETPRGIASSRNSHRNVGGSVSATAAGFAPGLRGGCVFFCSYSKAFGRRGETVALDGSAVNEKRAAGDGGVDGVRVDFLGDGVGDLKVGGKGGGGGKKKWGKQTGRVFAHLLFDILPMMKTVNKQKECYQNKTANK